MHLSRQSVITHSSHLGDLSILMYIPTQQTYSDILRHNQESSGIFRRIQAYPESCATLAYSAPSLFRTYAYSELDAFSEPWHIQKPGIFRTRGISLTLVNSEPCQTPAMEHFTKIFIGYNYFCNISF